MVNSKSSLKATSPIWLVEDDTSSQDVIRNILQEQGYAVSCFQNAEDAYHVLQRGETPPALVLLDLMLPGMSGMDLIRLMKENSVWKTIPVVIVTSLSRHDARAEKDDVGGQWLRKPVDTNELILTIKSLLAS